MDFKETLVKLDSRYRRWIVWALRILVGATFVMSGLVKSIDVWGFVYKLSEYFTTWNIPQPNSLYLIMAIMVASAEFILGALLMLGCMKRVSAWLLTAMMAFMLPLTLYIWIASPVADCGCFGDFWVISNGATFFKNVLLTVALIYLSVYNRKVGGVFRPYVQWLVIIGLFIYIIAVALIGYIIQPLADFRPYPVGSELVSGAEDSDDAAIEFVYEKDGRRETFSEDNLPDSTWTFVERVEPEKQSAEKSIAIYDEDVDVTEDVISTDEPQIVVLLPDMDRTNVSFTYVVNELQRAVDRRGGSLIEIAGATDDELNQWRDLSMATYPIYSADPLSIKEIARGDMSAVYLEGGKIKWKRSLSSIDTEALNELPRGTDAIDYLYFDGTRYLRVLSLLLVGWLAVTFLLDRLVASLRIRRFRKRHNPPTVAEKTKATEGEPEKNT